MINHSRTGSNYDFGIDLDLNNSLPHLLEYLEMGVYLSPKSGTRVIQMPSHWWGRGTHACPMPEFWSASAPNGRKWTPMTTGTLDIGIPSNPTLFHADGDPLSWGSWYSTGTGEYTDDIVITPKGLDGDCYFSFKLDIMVNKDLL